MTTHNNKDDEPLSPERSSPSISNSAPEPPIDPTENEGKEVTKATKQPIEQPTVSLSQDPVHPPSNTETTTLSAKPKKSLLGMAMFTAGVSSGALGCGLTLARGPFADLVTFLEPMAQRGLTGGSMILTGLVLTAMSVVERQLRKQAQALETQEGNAAILQDVFGSMASITTRLAAIEAGERQVYAEANTMRNELHQYIASQDGKEEQTGIFHVAASVDKLSANVDRTLKRFGSDLESNLTTVREDAQITNQKLEAKLQELESQELPDNTELIEAQAQTAECLQGLKSDLQTSMEHIMQEKFTELRPHEAYDDSALLASQSEITDRLAALEGHLDSIRARFGEVQDALLCSTETLSRGVQETVDTRVEELRRELEQVCNAVESAMESTLESPPTQHSISFDSVVPSADSTQVFLASEPDVQTWPMDGIQDATSAHRIQENPPLKILHMPSEEEMASVVDEEQEQLAHSTDNLFHAIAPAQEEEADAPQEMVMDNIPQPHDPGQDSTASFETSEDHAPFLSSNPQGPIPGTPGSPFPAPIPLKPVDSDTGEYPPMESSGEFHNPYEPPSEAPGFQGPEWN
ncbi:MAG: apolipoprotein A1/A4/E family protein [bacterium]|nr:apolipoprotein A1/A4/E family protein [bacterium]